MKKNRKKNRAKFIDQKLQTAFIIALLTALVIFGGSVVINIFFVLPEPWQSIFAFVTGIVDTLSAFLVPVLSIWITYLVIRSKNKLEEEFKIEPDHHKIIHKYKGHSRVFTDYSKETVNVHDENGVLMSLKNVADELPFSPKDSDEFSDEHFERQRDITAYKSGRLLLPCLSVFTNNLLNVTITIADSTVPYTLPSVLKGNETKLISAHKASNVSNSATIRLTDFKCDEAGSTLELQTARSNYLDMLMTNRCMDFDIGGMSVRSLCESETKVKPLNKSELCNQIGINGLVYTKDNYLLVEKRGLKKAVWKNKFAQPISLALKLKDVKTNSKGLIGNTAQDAEDCFKNVISKTLGGNFGLTVDGDYRFELSKNFMGIARDLLEGGKPNLYFYVVVDMTAAELKNYLEANSKLAIRFSQARDALNNGIEKNDSIETPLYKMSDKSKSELIALIREGYITVTEHNGKDVLQFVSARKAAPLSNADETIARLNQMKQSEVDKYISDILSKKLPKVNKDKLDSQFYLIKRNDFKLDYNYATEIPANKVLGVQRIFAPCVSAQQEKREKRRIQKYTIDADCKSNGKPLRYECGEALLASLYYASVLNLEDRNKTTEK